MTYTRVMYDMPPNKVGERDEGDFWKLKIKPPGAMAASCVVNKYWEDIHAFHEETFNEIVCFIHQQMIDVSFLTLSCFGNLVRNRHLTDLFFSQQNPPKKSGPIKRYILRKIGLGLIIRREDMTPKDHAHEAYPMFEEISDEEWMRRATPLHYPYHTPASQKAYDEEMRVRRINRAERWDKKFADYAAREEAIKRENAAKAYMSSISGSSGTDSTSWDSGSSHYTGASDDSSLDSSPDSFFSSFHTDRELKQALVETYDELIALEAEGVDQSGTQYRRELKLATKIEALIRAKWASEDRKKAVDVDDSNGIYSFDSLSNSDDSEASEDIADSAEFLDDDSSTKVGSGSEPHSDSTAVEFPELEPEVESKRKPNWSIKLDYYEDLNIGFLDPEDHPFLIPDDVKYLDNGDPQGLFNVKNLRILEEVHARLFSNRIKKDGFEYQQLASLQQRLVEAIEFGLQSYQSEDDQDAKRNDNSESEKSIFKDLQPRGDDSDDDCDDDPDAPDWLRTCSRNPMLTVEAPDIDSNPHRVGLVHMRNDEEVRYLAERRLRQQREVQLFEAEQERKVRIAEEVKERGNGIKWLHTREIEGFPTSPRVSPSPQRASPPIATQDDMSLPALAEETSMEVGTAVLTSGQNLKCFNAGPHLARDYGSPEPSPASSPKKKSRIARGLEKFKRGLHKSQS
jgi:hypothetical protein